MQRTISLQVAAGLLAAATSVLATQDRAEAVGLARQARGLAASCDSGDLNACLALSLAYELGDGGHPKDLPRAAGFARRACDGGHTFGCLTLADMYKAGIGLERDLARAARIFEETCGESPDAAPNKYWDQNGADIACASLGAIYGTGEGVAKDAARAAELFHRGCKSGAVGRACVELARILEPGEEVADNDEALCREGAATSCLDLGRRHLAAGDAEVARGFYEKACSAGSAEGCSGLTNYYAGKASESKSKREMAEYAGRGLAAAKRALEMDPLNFETIVYQGLLYGVQGRATSDPVLFRAARAKQSENTARAIRLREEGGHRSRSEDRFWEPPPPPPPARPPSSSSSQPPAGAAGADTPVAPVRVGGKVKQPRKLVDVRPVYPEKAKAARVQGVVLVECTIGADGRVSDATILRGIPLLDQAAIDAVRQWVYEPTVMNGVTVPVIMTVPLDFRNR